MSRSLLAALLLVLALAAGACASDDDPAAEVDDVDEGIESVDGETPSEVEDAPNVAEDPDINADDVETEFEAAVPYSAEVTLTGDAEVPGPGSTGTGEVRFSIDDDEACLAGTLEGVGAVVAGHIHTGTAEESGGVLLDLAVMTDGDGEFESCVPVDAATAQVISTDPAGHYVNLHTAEFPDGAVRGQLS